ncbi:hypothetical protein C1J00_07200, partial [Streptomyces cahuitamycinicus]
MALLAGSASVASAGDYNDEPGIVIVNENENTNTNSNDNDNTATATADVEVDLVDEADAAPA